MSARPDDVFASPPVPGLPAALELLERAVSYTRSSLQLITAEAIHAATPCSEWDLADLLRHMDDSLRALQDAADTGRVVMVPRDPDDPDSPVSSLKNRACALLGAWTANGGADLVSVAGCPLTAQVLVGTGALEIAVHGWDVAQACGSELPMPAPLSGALLPLVPTVVTDRDRGTRFAPQVTVPPWASPGDRLVAALGRQPWRSVESEAV
jgi:uncharacterized protein (TIGR03086 family)